MEENPMNAVLKKDSIDEYCKKSMLLARNSQKFSNELQGWQHYSDYSGVNFTMKKINEKIHQMVKNIFEHQDINLNVNKCNLSEQFEIIREGNDALLEKVNFDLDEAKGVKRHSNMQNIDSDIRTIRSVSNEGTGSEMILMAPRNVQKPQLFFSPKIDNTDQPFIPLITEKPNSLKPISMLISIDQNGREYYSHPYEYELEHLRLTERALLPMDPITPPQLSSTPLVHVKDVDSLNQLVDELSRMEEFAVDVEHHSFRSYQGLTCLIQISTREKDYLIDPFPLRNHLRSLNEVFTNPNITKVFHGADFDILWLQRDFGIYVVNMFDTHQAAVVLDYPHRSLAYLLLLFASVTVNKNYQRADWRIRPLPDDFCEYGRMDTHFLLFIYDLMKKELLDKGNEMNNLLTATYNRSTELCLKRYDKPIMGLDSYVDLYRKSRKQFNNRQIFALQQIFLWRDNLARQQDESVDYVLPKHMMLQIAEILPKEVHGIFACCNPIPPLIKTEHLTLHQIIRTAREMSADEISKKLVHVHPQDHMDLNSLINLYEKGSSILCRHDLSITEEDPKGLDTIVCPQKTLFGDLFAQNTVCIQLKKESVLFGRSFNCFKKIPKLIRTVAPFLSPYERHKLINNQDFNTSNNILNSAHPEVKENNKSGAVKQETQTVDSSDIERRMNRILDSLGFIINETQQSQYNSQTSPILKTPDLERMNRLQLHVESLVDGSSENVAKDEGSAKSREERNVHLQKSKVKKKLSKKKNRSNPADQSFEIIDAKNDVAQNNTNDESGSLDEEEKVDVNSSVYSEEEKVDVNSSVYSEESFGIFHRKRRGGAKFRGGRGHKTFNLKSKGPRDGAVGSKKKNRKPYSRPQ